MEARPDGMYDWERGRKAARMASDSDEDMHAGELEVRCALERGDPAGAAELAAILLAALPTP